MQRTINLGLSALFFLCAHMLFSQTEISVDQKLKRIKYAVNDFNGLPYESDVFQNDIVPMIETERASLAPHYPDLSQANGVAAQEDQLYIDWINQYPDEHRDYATYLETFIRSHR